MKIKINLPSDKTYDITIDELKKISFDRKVLIVTNDTIAKLHLEKLKDKIKAKECSVVILKDGEEYKTLESVIEITKYCFEKRLDRKSLLIAFGGGVIGDMTGFAASVYLRGIDFIQIPTTLLSQVDASVGGKTGFNVEYGKNLIGSFHQPKAVFIDSYFLKTLPAREFNAGIAEIVKMAVTFDKDFFNWIEKNKISLENDDNVKATIKRSVEIKADIVAKDEKEQGIRAVLNYGHTFAHVVENETNYSKYLHGEAVGIGICMANKLSVKLGLLNENEEERIANLLKSYNIPVSYGIKSVDSFYDHFFLDKKTSNDKIKFILSNGIGSYKIVENIDKKIIMEVLEVYKID